MKICSYSLKNALIKERRLGLLLPDQRVMDCNLVLALDYQREGFYRERERANSTLPSSLYKLLRIKTDVFEVLEESYGLFLFFQKLGIDHLSDGTRIAFSANEYQLHAPLDHIGTYRDFFAHEKHVRTGFKKRNEEIPAPWFEMPVYYKGATAGFIGPDEEILWPNYTDVLDYELEMAAVIGRDIKNVKEEDALNCILGFTVLNDISARDIQRKEMMVRLGPAKGKDFCSVIGPVIATLDEFDNKEPNLTMTAKINGAEWSRGQSGDSNFTFAQMLAHAAKEEWVLAGDLIGSGTVGTGCGLELDKWIKPGDELELSIEGIGTLKNRVGQKRL
jgi:2-keto-4-pentenoate hydratase/2-oxohepta-3-ene-1,7-dioic acid hydratase in catechol pathway